MENLEKMGDFIKDFYEDLKNLDPTQITGEVKENFLKVKEIVNEVNLPVEKIEYNSSADQFKDLM